MWTVAAGTAQWSMKPHALGSPFTLLGPKGYLRPRITRRKKTNKQTMIQRDVTIFSLEMITRKWI